MEPSNAITLYRPEIDGLRAIAVSAVIVHHFSEQLLPGGFLGVDMFFVISGYVITTSLINEPNVSAKELLLGFYARRVKRLFPALIVCVLVTALLGALVISPDNPEFSRIMNGGALSLVGMSNIYFYHEARDYFGASTALNLFTHTWSLGVEEQFYLLFPALLCLCGVATRGSRLQQPLIMALTGLSGLSFAAYLWRFQLDAGAFFMLPYRFWELCTGCLVALLPTMGGKRVDEGSSLAAVNAVAVGAAVTAFLAPAEWRLFATPFVVAATAALIVALRPGQAIYQLLNLRVVLLLGLMSYSLYLWHWSVLVIARWTVGVGPLTAPFLLATMLGLAAMSYFLVERPLRRRAWASNNLATVAIAGTLTAGAVGLVIGLKGNRFGVLFTGVPVVMAAKGVETLRDDKWPVGRSGPSWRAKDCLLTSDDEVGKVIDLRACTIGGDPAVASRRFLVIGNSYSAAAFEMFTDLVEKRLGVVTVTSSWGASAVPEIPNTSPWSKVNSYYWDEVVPKLVSGLSRGDVIIMVNDIAHLTPNEMAESAQQKQRQLKSGLERLAHELQMKGVSIVFLAPLPFMRDAACTPDMARPQWFNLGSPPICHFHSHAYTMARRKPVMEVLGAIESGHTNFRVLDLLSLYCANATCAFFSSDKVPMYRDIYSHPSIEANILARPLLLAAIQSLAPEDRGQSTPR